MQIRTKIKKRKMSHKGEVSRFIWMSPYLKIQTYN